MRRALEPGVAGRTALTLRVQTGCDQRCSYCIIPSTRGAGRSKPLPAIRSALDRAIGAGYREIALTGVHLGSYGRDLGDGSSLLSLVRLLAEWPADVLFRLSSLEPMDCSAELVELVAASPRLAPHFHLPLQHASDEMLAAMRRPYSLAYFRDLVDLIRARMPHASIGSDVIVGFPGETDAHAAVLLDYLRESPLTHVHVFPYSHRPGTEASALDGMPPPPLVQQRSAAVRAASERLSRAFRAGQVGHRAARTGRGRRHRGGHRQLSAPRARSAVHAERVDRRRGRGRDQRSGRPSLSKGLKMSWPLQTQQCTSGAKIRIMVHRLSLIQGFHVHASDGYIGHVDDFLLDESAWQIRYIVVDTSNWLGGKWVAVSPTSVTRIDLSNREVHMALTRAADPREPEHGRSAGAVVRARPALRHHVSSAPLAGP